ncbi:MAG TPA: LTA synthase family protein [Symbiobacteriaceae bacterium]|nr:LTA synthase family protein [Symbiobacteriaceae bacterium]
MSQPVVKTVVQTDAAWKQRFLALVKFLPYMLFFVWMIYKQRVGLVASGIMPGPDMLIATVGAFLVISPWFYRAEGRKRLVLMALLDAVITFILFADILYYRQFGDLVSIASLRFLPQLATVKDSVTHLLLASDIWLWADILLIGALALLPHGSADHWWGRLQRATLGLKSSAVLSLSGVAVVTAVAFLDPYLSAKYYGHSMVASRMGLLNYHLFDIGNYLGRLAARMTPSAPAVAEVKQYFAPLRSPLPEQPPLYGVAKGKNVIVLQIESLQAFALGLKVDGQEVTPNMNRLAGESLNFTDFYTQTGQGVTSDADLLANCSLYPTRTGAVYYDYAANDYRCMPWLLRQNGYKAVAMQGMPPDFWNLASVYPHVGFEKYYNLKDGFTTDEKIGIGLSDMSFVRQAADHLKALPQPYYAFLVTLTSHGPFDFEGLPRELKLGDLEGTDAGHYLHAVHYTDKAIGVLLDRLKADGALDNSVIMLYGDHAGIFRGNSGIPELLPMAKEDEAGWTRMEKRIPFMIRLPGAAHAGEQINTAGQIDIAPTLAALLGVPTDSTYFFGRNLNQEPKGIVPFYTGSAMTDDLLFWSKDPNPALGKCYDRKTGAEVVIDLCKPIAEEAAESLRISRLLVSRNLIGQLAK